MANPFAKWSYSMVLFKGNVTLQKVQGINYTGA